MIFVFLLELVDGDLCKLGHLKEKLLRIGQPRYLHAKGYKVGECNISGKSGPIVHIRILVHLKLAFGTFRETKTVERTGRCPIFCHLKIFGRPTSKLSSILNSSAHHVFDLCARQALQHSLYHLRTQCRV